MAANQKSGGVGVQPEYQRAADIFACLSEIYCDLGRVCNGMKLSHPSMHKARMKQMLSQLGVLLFLLSRVQPDHMEVPLFVQCPSSGASEERGRQ